MADDDTSSSSPPIYCSGGHSTLVELGPDGRCPKCDSAGPALERDQLGLLYTRRVRFYRGQPPEQPPQIWSATFKADSPTEVDVAVRTVTAIAVLVLVALVVTGTGLAIVHTVRWLL